MSQSPFLSFKMQRCNQMLLHLPFNHLDFLPRNILSIITHFSNSSDASEDKNCLLLSSQKASQRLPSISASPWTLPEIKEHQDAWAPQSPLWKYFSSGLDFTTTLVIKRHGPTWQRCGGLHTQPCCQSDSSFFKLIFFTVDKVSRNGLGITLLSKFLCIQLTHSFQWQFVKNSRILCARYMVHGCI